jgi:hypothetical protein
MTSKTGKVENGRLWTRNVKVGACLLLFNEGNKGRSRTSEAGRLKVDGFGPET